MDVEIDFVFTSSSSSFRDPFQAHREHMRQMMRSFSEPYGGPIVPSIMDGRNCGMSEQPSSSLRGENRVRTFKKALHLRVVCLLVDLRDNK